MAKYMSLDRFAGGALLERFNLAMRQIVQNIADTNADPQKARTLTIKLTFKPDAGRSVKTSIATNVSLAPPIADETMMLIGKDARTGTVQMSEIDGCKPGSFRTGQHDSGKSRGCPTSSTGTGI